MIWGTKLAVTVGIAIAIVITYIATGAGASPDITPGIFLGSCLLATPVSIWVFRKVKGG